MLRDALINGNASTSIRQRLFEKDDLTYQQAVELAETLDRAPKRSASYYADVTVASSLAAEMKSDFGDCLNVNRDSSSMASAALANTKNASSLCFLCGGSFHQRSICPARNATCFSCGSRGHLLMLVGPKSDRILTR